MLKLKLQYLATWCEDPTHWKRPWCWERLRAGGEGGDRGWESWLASLTQWVWIWASFRRQWSLACCSSWDRKELDMTEWLNNKNNSTDKASIARDAGMGRTFLMNRSRFPLVFMFYWKGLERAEIPICLELKWMTHYGPHSQRKWLWLISCIHRNSAWLLVCRDPPRGFSTAGQTGMHLGCMGWHF